MVPLLLYLLALVSLSYGCFDVEKDPESGGLLISSTQVNARYLPHVNCTYKITQFLPYGLIYEFAWLDFDSDEPTYRPCKGSATTCFKQCTLNDWVAILDEDGNEITRRCGNEKTVHRYLTKPGQGIIWYHTGMWDRGTGFVIRVTVDPDTIPCTSTSLVSGENGTLSNYVRPFYGRYRPNENCKWLITVPDKFDTIKIVFTKVKVQGVCGSTTAKCDCPNDGVTVFDGRNELAPVLTRRCGYDAPQQAYYTARSNRPTAFVWFKADERFEFEGWQMTYEGCNAPCEVALPETTTPIPSYQWPSGNSMVGFWPLDQRNRLHDMSQHQLRCTKNCHGELDDEDKVGPFGDPFTSHHSRGANESILTVDSLIKNQSFTVAFFVRVPMSEASGILSFVDDGGTQIFAVESVPTSEGTIRPLLRVRGGESATADVYGPYDVIWPDVWTFLVVTFNGESCTLAINGKYGELYKPAYKESLCKNKLKKHFRLGLTSVDNVPSTLSSSASISCVSVYSAALSYKEIIPIHEACRVAHQSLPCGAPRLSHLPPIPTLSFGVSTYGQFPYIASLKRSIGSLHICAATILDAYYLITAATCLEKSKEPFYYSVVVGEHELSGSKGDSFERRHSISRISISGAFNTNYSNIAIIELSSPIDFSNSYANSICIPETIHTSKIERAFVFGWGSNGRPDDPSTNVPRYASGTTSACGSEGNDICFQSNSDRDVPCDLDKGGPLLVPGDTLGAKNSRLRPIGIFGARLDSDCNKRAPVLFTKVALDDVRAQIACILPGFFYPSNCPIDFS